MLGFVCPTKTFVFVSIRSVFVDNNSTSSLPCFHSNIEWLLRKNRATIKRINGLKPLFFHNPTRTLESHVFVYHYVFSFSLTRPPDLTMKLFVSGMNNQFFVINRQLIFHNVPPIDI